jgi:hypothetical protein
MICGGCGTLTSGPHLCRAVLEREHPGWSVRPVRRGRGWTAKHQATRRVVWAGRLTALAATLREVQ